MRQPLRRAALSLAFVATVPYLALKLMWLSGATIGMTSDADASEMSGTRFVTGNVITVALMVTAVAFAVAVTRSWARRVPAWLVLVLSAGATGLLAPILLGLPLGMVIQLAVEGDVQPADDTGLATWVFAVVYSGFGLLAIAMAVLMAAYVLDRWGHLMTGPPRPPTAPAVLAGAVGMLPFGAAMIAWGAFGPGTTGPQGMDLPAQRTVLVVTGALSVAAFVVPFLHERVHGWPRGAWLVAWTGASISAVQAPTQILLAEGGDVRPVVALIALLAIPGSSVYGLATLRGHLSARSRVTDGGAPSSRVRPAKAEAGI
jgi:hypothetical protein